MVIYKAPMGYLFVRAGGMRPVDAALSRVKAVILEKSADSSTLQDTEMRSMKWPRLLTSSCVGENCSDICILAFVARVA